MKLRNVELLTFFNTMILNEERNPSKLSFETDTNF